MASKTRAGCQYRIHLWLNHQTNEPMFGLQARIPGRRGWFHMHEDGTPMIYETEAKANAVMSALSTKPGSAS